MSSTAIVAAESSSIVSGSIVASLASSVAVGPAAVS